MAFVTLTKDQFTQWADAVLTEQNGFLNWKQQLPKNGTELVLVSALKTKPQLEVRIYTTLDPNGETRKLGEDAIRTVLFDTISGKAVESFPKILRTEGQTSVFERLTKKLPEVLQKAASLVYCKKCGAYQVKRVAKATGVAFMGCGAWPNCGKNAPYDLRDVGTHKSTITATTMVEKKDIIPINKTTVMEDMTPLVELDSLYPREVFPHYQYPFTHFNRVQSTILQHGYWNQDCNLVLGTSTSTGKTISGELFVWETLKVHKKKVCYVSPLKSLTKEKFEDWTASFGADYKICILTGDYTLTEDTARKLNEADLVCLTSEMIDSRTRNYKSEKSDWLFEVGLVITDESHIISTNRGHAVEVGLMRFCKLVPDARILMLSATMPNVSEFKEWLTNLNGKETNVINNNWRPTQLQWHFPMFEGYSYADQQESKMKLAADIVEDYSEDKTLVFVHDKNTGRQMEFKLRQRGIHAQFHNADLDSEERDTIEKSFKSDEEDSMRVLISTSTLAWGVNTSAVNAVIVGTTRGLNTVDELDIIQMAGRAGRLGKSDIGRCFLVNNDPEAWKFKVTNPRNIISTLIDKDILGFHVLAEIANGEVYNKPTLMKWFERSLASIQIEVEDKFIQEVLDELLSLNMMSVTEQGYFKVTALGRVSASLYYYPRDVAHWAVMFSRLTEKNLWGSDLALSYALGTTPSFQLDYVPKQEQNAVEDYYRALNKNVPEVLGNGQSSFRSVIASDLYNLITEQKGAHLHARQIKIDIQRITGALHWIDSISDWDKETELSMLELRVNYGVRAGLAEFCRLPGIGIARAKKLEAAGIKSLQDLIDQPEKATRELGMSIASKAIASAKNFLKKAA